MRVLCFLLLFFAAVAAWGETVSLDAFKKPWNWTYNNNSRGSGETRQDSVMLRYDFSRGDYTCHVSMGCPLGLERVPEAVRFEIKKSSGHSMAFRLTDAEGETFQKKMNIPVCPDWQETEVSVSGFGFSWGEKKNGVFDGAPSSIGFAVEQGLISETSGVLEIRNVRAVYGKDRGRLALGSAPFGDVREVKYRTGFSPVKAQTEGDAFVTRGDEALSGSVDAVLVPVKGKGRVTVRTACQFDRFTMTREGEGVIEFPCGQHMEGWAVDALSFSGTLYAPLRLTEIVYEGTEPDGDPLCVTVVPVGEIITAAPTWEKKNKNAVFHVKVKCLEEDPAPMDMFLDVRDYNGVPVTTLKKRVRLSGMGKEDLFSFEAPFGKEPLLEALVRFASPALGSAAPALPDANRCTVCALDIEKSLYKNLKAADIKESPFGMGVYLYRRQGEAIEKTARLAGDIGIKWTREEFNWGAIEQQKGVLDYRHYDDIVDAARRNGIQIYGLLCYWNHNYPQDNDEGRAAYYNYVRETVLRYKDRIRYWEIWNEPNIGFFPGDKANYYLMLREAYALIKEIDPELKVMGCSTSLIDFDFIEKAIDSGCDFDVLSVHPYRARIDDDAYAEELERAVKLTEKIDGRPREVWITEMGLPTHLYTGATEKEQMSFLVRSYAGAASVEHVNDISAYDFINDGENRFYNEHSFGVLWHDMRPKPSYIALATLIAAANGGKPAGRAEFCPEVRAHAYEKEGYKGYALWSLEDGLFEVEGDAVFYDALGRRIEGK
ncbi:MAG: endo-1,4-beta-xylanase, partial [Abditibacteriota bacterium]|nr:endo-1,4-beta-xylanase [Abditibacteriota bacterium]